MSDNSYILVKELKNKRFKVVHLDADTNCQFGRAIKAGDLRDAVDKANDLQREEETEYGISFDLIKK